MYFMEEIVVMNSTDYTLLHFIRFQKRIKVARFRTWFLFYEDQNREVAKVINQPKLQI